MAKSGRNKPRISGNRQTDKNANRILKELGLAALSLLPAGAVIRGGVLLYKGYKGARAMAAARKAIATTKQAKQLANKPKPATASKPKPESGKTTVIPKPSKAVAVQGSSAAKKTAQPKPMKRVQGTDKTVPKKTLKSPPTKTPSKTKLTKAQKLAIAGGLTAAGVTGLGSTATQLSAMRSENTPSKKLLTPEQQRAFRSAKKPKAIVKTESNTSTQNSNVKKRTARTDKEIAAMMQERKVKPKVSSKTRTDKEIAAMMQERKVKPKASSTTVTKPKDNVKLNRTSISAGKDTGFGLKGNIFPRNAAERKSLMAKFGGTGSAAAKAAARGTQGNLKKGKK